MRRLCVSLILLLVIISSFSVYAEKKPLSPFGIMGFSYSHNYYTKDKWEQGDKHLGLLETTGAKWARQDFWWGIVEPEKDKWEWEHTDKAMQSYKKHNIKPLAILCYGSEWYKNAPDTMEEKENYSEYVYNMVDRYKDICKH